MAKQSFDRIHFDCKCCGAPGVILSASVNLTYVILEGFCIGCRTGMVTTFDLLLIDKILVAGNVVQNKDVIVEQEPTKLEVLPPAA